MTSADCMERLLLSYERYYDISKTKDDFFFARAHFSAKNEEFFLVKEARLSQSISNEYVFFVLVPSLSEETLALMCAEAWDETLRVAAPFFGHRNTDCTLIVVTDSIEEGVARLAKKTRFYKSYKLTLYGWSSFSLCVVNPADGKVISNGRGRRDAARIRKQLRLMEKAANDASAG